MKQYSIFGQIVSLDNLINAWRRIEYSFQAKEVWFDEIEYFRYKVNLIDNLRNLSERLKNGEYDMQPISPIPYPKGPETVKETGEVRLRVRQGFCVHVEDQLVWMAVYNVIGPTFEKLMPAWSYGHRMYVTTWKEGKDWLHGEYRRTSRNFEMKWNQGWPLYRRNLAASIKRLANVELEKEDQDAVEQNEKQTDNLKLKYLNNKYFNHEKGAKWDELYWAAIDFEKFYQHVRMTHVKDLIFKYSRGVNEEKFRKLIDKICSFQVDYQNYADEEKTMMQLDKPFVGVPTGLIVAGAIANLYMLEIDMEVEKRLEKNKNVIHFRYVDDHVIVANNPKVLYNWVDEYVKLVSKDDYVVVNKDKFEPNGIAVLFGNDAEVGKIDNTDEVIEQTCHLDSHYPSPLMTQTLMKVSQLGQFDMNLLTKNEFNLVMTDLKEMLVTDIPEQEIKKVTRISFACSLLAKMNVQSDIDYQHIHDLKIEWLSYIEKLKQPNQLTNLIVEDKNNLLRDLRNIIFDETFTKPKIGEPDKQKYEGIDFKTIDDIKEELDTGKTHDNSRKKSILNLIYRSIIELPERNKIWERGYQYALKHLPEELNRLFERLDGLVKLGRIHPMTHEYLSAMLTLMRSQSIVLLLKKLRTDEALPFDEKELAIRQLDQVAKAPIPEARHPFSYAPLIILCKTISLYNSFCQDYGLPKVNISEYHFKGYEDIEDDKCFWMLWCADKINGKSPKENIIINELFEKQHGAIDMNSPFAPRLFLEALGNRNVNWMANDITNEQFHKNLEKIIDKKEVAYLVYEQPEIDKNIKSAFIPKGYSKELTKYKPKGGYISMPEWIDYVNNMTEDKSPNFHVLRSEYLCVKIMQGIISELLKNNAIELIFMSSINIHPSNIFFKKSQLKEDWHHWLSEGSKFEVEIGGMNLPIESFAVGNSSYVFLNSYAPYEMSMFFSTRSYIYGLGIIFLQLIAGEKTLPWMLARPEYGFEWRSVLHRLLQEGKISTCNYQLIVGCLSNKSNETILMTQVEQIKDVHDYQYTDGELVTSIEDFQKRLESNEKVLSKNVVSLLNQQYRQIIEIQL